MKKIISGAVAILFLAACQQNGAGYPTLSKGELGSIIGGAAGAAIGSQIGDGSGGTVATATGTLLGAALGRSIGQSLGNADLSYYHQASQKAMELGQPGQLFPWQSPTSNVTGTVTPSSYHQNAEGKYCREYTQTITVGGRLQEGHGVACRQSDGSWKIQS